MSIIDFAVLKIDLAIDQKIDLAIDQKIDLAVGQKNRFSSRSMY